MTENYRELKPQTYLQAPYKPTWFDERLKNIGGANPYGEPNYRVVWGMDERCFRSGNPQAIKYLGLAENELGMPAWILEEWWSPERLGTPEDWESSRWTWDEDTFERVDMLGLYPSRGMYFMFGQPLFDPEFKPIPLNEVLLSAIAGLIKNKLRGTPADQSRAFREIQEKAAREDKRRKELSQKQAAEAWDRYKTLGDETNRRQTRNWSLPSSPAAPDGMAQTNAGLFIPAHLTNDKVQ